jgi:hypothetical protein
LRGMTKNSPFCVFRAVFWAIAHCFGGSMDIYMEYDSLYILERIEKKTHRLCVYAHFRELLPTVLGFQGDLQGRWHLVHVWVAWPKTRRFCILGPFSWAIAHSFGVPGWFTRTMTLSTFFWSTTKN